MDILKFSSPSFFTQHNGKEIEKASKFSTQPVPIDDWEQKCVTAIGFVERQLKSNYFRVPINKITYK